MGSSPKSPVPLSESKGAAPCDELHIYHIHGFPACDDAGLGPAFLGNWQEEDYAFLFFSEPSEPLIDRLLAARPDLTLLDKYHMKYDDWHGVKPVPFRVGRLLIYPPWDPPRTQKKTYGIQLDPGVVFGTGTHATTRDCLEAIDRLLPDKTIQTALDLGTGTGVLAIAAATLGCRHAVAVDLNGLAVQTAARNVRKNGLQDRVWVLQGEAETLIGCRADLLVANVHHAVMQKLVRSEAFSSKRWFVLSGLLRRQAKEIREMLIRRRADVLETWHRDDTWFTMLGKNPERSP
jgi:ribosomal protein L11 methyltransferase